MMVFFSLRIKSRSRRVSMILARVAGVPMPQSLMALRVSVSSISRPAFSMAERSVASVNKGLGLVLCCVIAPRSSFKLSPSCRQGSCTRTSSFSSSLSSALFFSPWGVYAFHPCNKICLPRQTNRWVPSVSSICMRSSWALGAKASTKRMQIIW